MVQRKESILPRWNGILESWGIKRLYKRNRNKLNHSTTSGRTNPSKKLQKFLALANFLSCYFVTLRNMFCLFKTYYADCHVESHRRMQQKQRSRSYAQNTQHLLPYIRQILQVDCLCQQRLSEGAGILSKFNIKIQCASAGKNVLSDILSCPNLI
jgi:hypothetical protein